MKIIALALATVVSLTSLSAIPVGAAPAPTPTFGNPVPVTILGYSGDAMEPFVSGKYLFFNNRNAAGTDTNLFYAQKVTKTQYRYVGPLTGANSTALDAVATMDASKNFYFVSTRSYSQTLSTIYHGTFSKKGVRNVALVPGVSKLAAPWVNFDVTVSRDGNTMVFVDGQFDAAGTAVKADLAIAQRTSTGFTRPATSTALLAKVNTTGALEYGAEISKDGLALFFTRATTPLGSSNPVIMVATRASTTVAFGAPTALGALTGFVEAPTLSANGKLLYFHKLVGSRFAIYLASMR